METFSRINFWMAIFCVCFPAKSFPLGKMEDSNINLMRTDVTCEQDLKFYTPKNTKQECLTAALRCFKAELQTVQFECKDPEEVITQAQDFLQDHISARESGELNSTVCSCESWSEMPFPDFLDAMESLLQRIYSQARENQPRST